MIERLKGTAVSIKAKLFLEKDVNMSDQKKVVRKFTKDSFCGAEKLRPDALHELQINSFSGATNLRPLESKGISPKGNSSEQDKDDKK